MSNTRAGGPAPLRTPLCDLLGLTHPILQSGMGRIAGPELVAAVSGAGGLGILAGLMLPPDELRHQIRRVRELTDRPFGVNLWLHTALRPPVDPATVPSETKRAVHTVLNRFRLELGLPPRDDEVEPLPDLLDQALDVILDEQVPVWSIGLGDPGPDRVGRCHARGIRVIAMVATVADARAVAASGVDAIVAQGAEAGGHRSTFVKPSSPEAGAVGTLALVPQIVDAVRVPVVASGGIADGRGLAAALALGAAGVLLGTRFVVTVESQAPEFWKRAILDGDADATTVTDVFTGLHARVVRNRFWEEYVASKAPVLPPLLQRNAAQDIYAAATRADAPEYFTLYSGQGLGLVRDLPGAGDVVRAIAREAADVVSRLTRAEGADPGLTAPALPR